jgi:hypothetical protein
MPDERKAQAIDLMARFADRTGLTSARREQRYLWTDAFAARNFLGLARVTGDARHAQLAVELVHRVHAALGQHRPDDARTGWISGLGAEEGKAHPTSGGLRIGKELPERGPRDPLDDRLEWDRDGQYFHYLTQWMHALDRVAWATGKSVFNVWARELGDAAFRAFTYLPGEGGQRRMYWKMSIDLSRPLVRSMGQHDPLDGYVTCAELDATRTAMGGPAPDIGSQVAALAAMIDEDHLATADPLGIGGLLVDAFRVEQLMRGGAIRGDRLLHAVLSAALDGLDVYARGRELRLPADQRLAFRELGLAIGLRGVSLMWQSARGDPRRFSGGSDVRSVLDALSRHVPLASRIEAFWLEPAHQQTSTWTEHQNIDEVMLATSLVPDGVLGSAGE